MQIDFQVSEATKRTELGTKINNSRKKDQIHINRVILDIKRPNITQITNKDNEKIKNIGLVVDSIVIVSLGRFIIIRIVSYLERIKIHCLGN